MEKMYYIITAKRWFQKTYGNTYHSVIVEKVLHEYDKTEKTVLGYEPFVYGYGDHYLQTACDILQVEKLPKNCVIIVNEVNRKKDL
jgi:hypothetical protein